MFTVNYLAIHVGNSCNTFFCIIFLICCARGFTLILLLYTAAYLASYVTQKILLFELCSIQSFLYENRFVCGSCGTCLDCMLPGVQVTTGMGFFLH